MAITGHMFAVECNLDFVYLFSLFKAAHAGMVFSKVSEDLAELKQKPRF